MRAPSAKTVALRDRILASLRERVLATTAEVCLAACAHCAERGHHICYTEIYANLRALAKLGLVVWTPTDGVSSTAWSLSPKGREQIVDPLALEALWRAPAASKRGDQ
jgi:hypothetical protein